MDTETRLQFLNEAKKQFIEWKATEYLEKKKFWSQRSVKKVMKTVIWA